MTWLLLLLSVCLASGDGGGGVVGSKEGGEEAVVLRANGTVQVAGWLAARVCPQRHHELWHRHFLACLLPPQQQQQGDDDEGGGGLGAVVCCGRSGLQPLFVNPYSKRLQLSPPPPPRPCRGGILADAMVRTPPPPHGWHAFVMRQRRR